MPAIVNSILETRHQTVAISGKPESSRLRMEIRSERSGGISGNGPADSGFGSTCESPAGVIAADGASSPVMIGALPFFESRQYACIPVPPEQVLTGQLPAANLATCREYTQNGFFADFAQGNCIFALFYAAKTIRFLIGDLNREAGKHLLLADNLGHTGLLKLPQ